MSSTFQTGARIFPCAKCFWHSFAGGHRMHLYHSAVADLLADKLWGTENRRFRLRQNQAGSANCAAALAAGEFHSNPYCHRTDGVVTDRA